MTKFTPIISMVVIGLLLAYAMRLGINGVALAIGVGIIAGLGGYVAPHRKKPE